jgi:hypothetical protein
MRKKMKHVASFPSSKARTAKATLRSKRPVPAPTVEPRRSIAEIIDEYHDRRAKIVR